MSTSSKKTTTKKQADSPPADETPASSAKAAGGDATPVKANYGTAESKTPGRTRIRVKQELRDPAVMARIQEEVSKHENVKDVTINPKTGSVVIKHDLHRDGHDVFHEALKDAELVAGLFLEVPLGEDGEEEQKDAPDTSGEYGKLDQTLSDLVYRIDKAVYKRTGLRFRGQLLAGSIAAVGLVQIAMVGLTIEMLPGPVLLYIAYDIYHRESKEPPLDAPDEAEAGQGAEEPVAANPAPATA